MMVGNADVQDINAHTGDLNKAEAVVLALDTRASELKVDA